MSKFGGIMARLERWKEDVRRELRLGKGKDSRVDEEWFREMCRREGMDEFRIQCAWRAYEEGRL